MVKSPGRSREQKAKEITSSEDESVAGIPELKSPAKLAAMYARAGDERVILRAWEDFLTGVVHHGPSVRLVVSNSWLRCSQSGVSAYETRTPRVLSGGELYQLRERNKRLTDAAARTLIENAELLKGTHSMLVLTDSSGTVLEVAGDPYTIDTGQEINLVDGGNWNECVIGTNAIGTAIATKQAVQVHASEHYCEGVKKWTCAAAPIRDPRDQSILGVLDISGPNMSFCQHNLALALGAARQIESNLIATLVTENTRLLEACVSLQHRGKEGVVVLDQSGCVVFNNDRAIEQIQRGAISSALSVGERISEVGSKASTEELAKMLPADMRPDWLHEVKSGGTTLGSLLVIPEDIQRAVPKLSANKNMSTEPSSSSFREIIGQSSSIKATIKRARRIVATSAPVLIEGETGVGKELFARAIQSSGATTDGPYVVYNCGTASQELIGSELFGYVQGAFTGASDEGRVGRFEQADGGTLCLDEIGELPLALQPFLLRVLDEGIIYRLGENRPRSVAVRLIAMTNRHLREEVEAGRFRRDLYHRISVMSLLVPPLRERGSDVATLINHFNESLARQYEVNPRHYKPELIEKLLQYSWPGNVRANLKGLELTERQTIELMIKQCSGNMTRAAKQLGISRSTLYRKIDQYDLTH